MKSTFKALALATLAGTCAPVIAQDSVSNITGFPGDALDATATGDQCREYVVDLAPLFTSKGTQFGIAPILKSTRSNASFLNNLISAQSISPDMLTNVNSPSASYALWEMTPGMGVHTVFNDAPGSTAGPSGTVQFGATFAEFGTTDGGANFGAITSGVVNYDPAAPNRLYVTRRQTAVNTDTLAGAYNYAALGIGAVDANGNVSYRADGNGTAAGGPFAPIADNNIFSTDILSRSCNALNVIAAGATLDATTQTVFGSTTVHPTPNMLPESIFGASAGPATNNFSGTFVYGPTGSTSTAHIPGGLGGSTRGNIGFSSYDALGGGGSASYAQLGKDLAGDTRAIYVWEVDATGAPTSAFGADSSAVATFTDPTTGFVLDPAALFGILGITPEFDHYHSQIPFNGGVGQAAIGRDQAGRTIVAATHEDDAGSGNDYPMNSILAARWTPASAGATIEWTVVAYLDQLSASSTGGPQGKPICDANGDAIGRLVALFEVTSGAPLGPSMSSPAIDSVGNIWFVGAVGLFKNMDGSPRPVPVGDTQTTSIEDTDSALIRGVYNPATFGYDLELILELGDVFDGQNSGVPYQVTFTGIADSNSVSSGSFFSSNVSEQAWNGMSTAGLDTADPRTNGGVVLNAEIAYDVDPGDADSDGFIFNDPGDEEYNSLLYIGYYEEAAGGCPCDIEGDMDLDPDDIAAFVTAFTGGDLAADVEGDGDLDPDDIAAFVSCFTNPPSPDCDF